MKRRHLIPVLLGSALLVAGCGDDESSSDTTTAATASAGEVVTVARAWARTSPMEVTAGAAYMDLTAPAGDRLLGASVDPAVAAVVEVHETVMQDGAMAMQPVEVLELPAGETVSFAPGGYHLMILDLVEPLVLDQSFTITLDFEVSGEQNVTVTVRDDAP